jgi:hypothetical protein
MIGVHGNGLTHQLWMKPGSGVVEVSHAVSHPDPPSLIYCTVSLRQEKTTNVLVC